MKCEDTEYKAGVSERYYEMGGTENGYSRKDFLYYKVKSSKLYSIGDRVNFLGEELLICKVKMELTRGELIFTYTLGREKLLSLKRRYNSKISGMTVLGTVIGVLQDKVKLHLNIDKEQSEDTAYAFEWLPETGNLMYSVPKVGTKVSLYFPDNKESGAKAINCIRTNGDKCGDTANSQNRYFTTEHNKRLSMKTDTLSLTTKNKSDNVLQVVMNDTEGLKIQSYKKISIQADGPIQFESPMVTMQSLAAMNFNQGEGTTFYLDESFRVIGSLFYTRTSEVKMYPPIADAPEEKAFPIELAINRVLTGAAVSVLTVAAAAVVAYIAAPVIGAEVAIGIISGYCNWRINFRLYDLRRTRYRRQD
jgi:hypothetical protein